MRRAIPIAPLLAALLGVLAPVSLAHADHVDVNAFSARTVVPAAGQAPEYVARPPAPTLGTGIRIAATVEFLPLGTISFDSNDGLTSVAMDTTFGLGARLDHDLGPYVSVGAAPRVVFAVSSA